MHVKFYLLLWQKHGNSCKEMAEPMLSCILSTFSKNHIFSQHTGLYPAVAVWHDHAQFTLQHRFTLGLLMPTQLPHFVTSPQ